GRSRASLPWAAVSGLAPALGAAVTAMLSGVAGSAAGAGVLAELGLSGRAAAFTAAGTGLAAAYVLGRQARRREDLSLAFLAAGCAAVGVGTAWSGAEVGRMADMVALGAAFLIVEVAALAAIRDAFWRRPAAGLAGVAEVLAGVATMSLAFGLLIAPLVFSLGGSDAGRPAVGLAAALVAAGWLASGLRGSLGSGPAAERTVALDGFLQQERNTCLLPAAVAAVAAVQSGTGSPMATSAGLLVVAVALLATRAASSLATAAAFAVWAPVVVLDDPVAGLLFGLAGAAVAGEVAVLTARRGARPLGAVLSALPALASLAVAGAHASDVAAPLTVALGAVAACWALAVQLDRGRAQLGDVGRFAAALPVVILGLHGGRATDLFAVAAAVAAVLTIEAVRLRRPAVGNGAALVAQVALYAGAWAAGLDAAGAGVALCVGALAWAGLAAAVEEPWREPFLVATVAGAGSGLALATGDPNALFDALLVVGGLLVAAGIVHHPAPGWGMAAHAGGALLVAGVVGHLALAGVTAAEAFAVPVAAHLLVAGGYTRRAGAGAGAGSPPALSSWLAYAPSVALLGGFALVERMSGGAGWHALVAGAVGLAAVAAGGQWRLSGPLVTGTALLVAVTVHESLATLATVPTWAWLALGGSVLIGLGVLLERRGASPAETGRRVVDVLAEQFS
ncbi:MAG: hypothetical protein M3P85_02990, partial [Actinomycetota bacterium]|nr:hypothetical protein [Actinomycetota bacterium]